MSFEAKNDQTGSPVAGMSDFEALLARDFSPDDARIVQHSVETLAAYLPENRPQGHQDPRCVVEAVIAELDSKLSAQINRIIHHPSFQQ